MKERGTPLDRQKFTWKELTRTQYSKLDADAFSRVRVILMNGIELEAMGFQHACARMNADLQQHLARVRRKSRRGALSFCRPQHWHWGPGARPALAGACPVRPPVSPAPVAGRVGLGRGRGRGHCPRPCEISSCE